MCVCVYLIIKLILNIFINIQCEGIYQDENKMNDNSK